jgi:hypothetical protein
LTDNASLSWGDRVLGARPSIVHEFMVADTIATIMSIEQKRFFIGTFGLGGYLIGILLLVNRITQTSHTFLNQQDPCNIHTHIANCSCQCLAISVVGFENYRQAVGNLPGDRTLYEDNTFAL